MVFHRDVQEETKQKTSREPRRSALRSGMVTGLALVVLGGSGAAGAAYLAQKFGRTAETDGLLAAYAVYLVLTIAKDSFEMCPRKADGHLLEKCVRYKLWHP